MVGELPLHVTNTIHRQLYQIGTLLLHTVQCRPALLYTAIPMCGVRTTRDALAGTRPVERSQRAPCAVSDKAIVPYEPLPPRGYSHVKNYIEQDRRTRGITRLI